MFEPGIGMLELTRKENPVLWLESPLVAREDREEATKLLFESLEAPAVFNASTAVMALYANNMTTGLVVALGQHNAHVVPVYEGYAKRSQTGRSKFNGALLGQYMNCLTRGLTVTTPPNDFSMEDMVAQVCRGTHGIASPP
jgi:actin-related protein